MVRSRLSEVPPPTSEARLTGTFTKTRISNLFSGSGAFVNDEDGTQTQVATAVPRLTPHEITNKLLPGGENAQSKLRAIPEPILNRMNVYEVQAPDHDAARAIALRL